MIIVASILFGCVIGSGVARWHFGKKQGWCRGSSDGFAASQGCHDHPWNWVLGDFE